MMIEIGTNLSNVLTVGMVCITIIFVAYFTTG